MISAYYLQRWWFQWPDAMYTRGGRYLKAASCRERRAKGKSHVDSSHSGYRRCCSCHCSVCQTQQWGTGTVDTNGNRKTRKIHSRAWINGCSRSWEGYFIHIHGYIITVLLSVSCLYRLWYSAFSGRGKKTCWDTWTSFPEVTSAFTELSVAPSSQITEDCMTLLERYAVRSHQWILFSQWSTPQVILTETEKYWKFATYQRCTSATCSPSCISGWICVVSDIVSTTGSP